MALRTVMKSTWILIGAALLIPASILMLARRIPWGPLWMAAATWMLLFLLLAYAQLRFYREGDMKHPRNRSGLPKTDASRVPAGLKSPRQRAIWQNLEQTRRLMQHKEKEFRRAPSIEEKRPPALPQNEEILFSADRSRLYSWPGALGSLVFLLIAALPSCPFSPAISFAFLLLGLSGLLLTAAQSQTRYYVTDYRILVKKKRPLSRARWSALHYHGDPCLSRKKSLGWDALTIESGKESIRVKGLRKQKLETMLDAIVSRPGMADR